jgi:hypothetical protein
LYLQSNQPIPAALSRFSWSEQISGAVSRFGV